jgi:Kef-type K+ transport system membrane component KefB
MMSPRLFALGMLLLLVASRALADTVVDPPRSEHVSAMPDTSSIDDDGASLGPLHSIELPPAPLDPDLMPVVTGAATMTPELANPERTVLGTFAGLIAIAVLAYLGGHRRVRELEQKLGLSQMITAGFPFVILGVIARLPSVGIVSDEVLSQLGPALRFALAWIGFVVGLRFDTRMLADVPAEAARAVVSVTVVPFACVVITCAAVLFGIENVGAQLLEDPVFLRDAILLGTAAAMTAPYGPDAEPARRRLVRLEELAGIVGMLAVAAYFRPHVGGTWQLPGTAWLFLTLGMGFVIGGIVYALLLRTKSETDFSVLTLGAIAFAGGAAAYLQLSPVVVAFVAGIMVANLPGTLKEQLQPTLRHFERPIYLLFLFVVGALWNLDDWRSWVLAIVFAAARLAGKYLGARLTWRRENLEARKALALAPMGPLAIAIVVSGRLLYSGGNIAFVSSAVVGGALLTEIMLQAGRRIFERMGAV